MFRAVPLAAAAAPRQTVAMRWLLPLALLMPAPLVAADDLAAQLALPVASGLTGARDAAVFAWIENAGGKRSLKIARPGQPPRTVTASTTDDGLTLYDVILSDDGEGIAYVRGGDGEFPDEEDLPNPGTKPVPPRQQVFVALGGAAPVAIGDGHSPVFAPAAKRLAFTRRGELWVWEPGSSPRRIARVPGEINRMRWSPDGAQLAFVDSRNGRSFIALIDVVGGDIRYVEAGLDSATEPAFSPDGTRIAYVRYLDPPAGAGADSGPYWSLHIADVATGRTTRRWAASAGKGGRWAGTRGRNLYWTAQGIVLPWEASGWLHAYVIQPEGSAAPRALTSGEFEVESFVPTRDGSAIVYAGNAGGSDRRRLWQVDLRGGAPRALTGAATMAFYPTPGGAALAAIATDARTLAHPVVVGPKLLPLGDRYSIPAFVAPEPLTFRAADGVEVHAQLFRATGTATRQPAIVYIHGGPRRQMLAGFHPSGYYSNAYILNQTLAARGYTVLAVNYRGGTGYGLALRDAPETGRDGASEYRDILAAGRWLAARGDVDPARIGVWGGSWGGYLTALALARDSDLFKVGVDFHGVHTLLRGVPDSLSPDAQLAARRLQWDSSPMGAIDRWRSPVLLIHGDDDLNVPFSQSLLLARELAARRISFRDLAFPNERHGFVRGEPWVKSLTATIDFLDATLRP